jgi:hypothetical protein
MIADSDCAPDSDPDDWYGASLQFSFVMGAPNAYEQLFQTIDSYILLI